MPERDLSSSHDAAAHKTKKPDTFVIVLMLLAVIASALALGLYGERPDDPDYADAEQYLIAGYHIAQHGTFSEVRTDVPANPSLGREPGYSLLLAGLMKLDPVFRAFTPSCLAENQDCRAFYSVPQWANAVFASAAAALVFLTVAYFYENLWAVWISAAHVWVNHQLSDQLFYLISDFLAVFLTALTSFAVVWAWKRKRALPLAWAAPAAALAALTLTKAVFLYLAITLFIIVLVTALFRRDQRRYMLTVLVIAGTVYALPVGGWMVRNHDVGGVLALTHGRTGLAISARETFNRMTPQQYAAGFVYWTRGFGDNLAKRLFPEEAWQAYDLNNPDGFYRRGHGDYGIRTNLLRQQNPGLTVQASQEEVDRQLVKSVLTNLPAHIATTVPLFYRGIWVDEFVLISLPALIWLTIAGLRRRQWMLLLVLAPGLFSLSFYPLVSINIPRYQLTAMPALALAFGYAVASFAGYAGRLRNRRKLSSD